MIINLIKVVLFKNIIVCLKKAKIKEKDMYYIILISVYLMESMCQVLKELQKKN